MSEDTILYDPEAVNAEPIKVDKIGRYRTRDGGTAWVYELGAYGSFPVNGFCTFNDGYGQESWTDRGTVWIGNKGEECSRDLIEYIGPLEESQPCESELVQALRNELALYQEFADDVAIHAAHDSDMWRPIGWLLFNLKALHENERVKGGNTK